MHTEIPLDRGLARAQRPVSIGVITSHPWLLALLASLPIGWLVACYFLGAPPGTRATGFIQYDQAYYMAEAREHWDGGFHLLYGLPASPDIDTPRVYFRLQTLFLGTLGKLTGAEPGWIYAAFGLVAMLVFFRLAIALYGSVVGLRSRAECLVLPLFLWGGGFTVLCGSLLQLSAGTGMRVRYGWLGRKSRSWRHLRYRSLLPRAVLWRSPGSVAAMVCGRVGIAGGCVRQPSLHRDGARVVPGRLGNFRTRGG